MMEAQPQPEPSSKSNATDGTALKDAGAALEETAALLKSILELAATEGRLALRAFRGLLVTAIYVAGLWVCVFVLAQGALACALVEAGLPWSVALVSVGVVDLGVIVVLSFYRSSLRARIGLPATRALLRGE
jgi:hypothetical protein